MLFPRRSNFLHKKIITAFNGYTFNFDWFYSCKLATLFAQANHIELIGEGKCKPRKVEVL